MNTNINITFYGLKGQGLIQSTPSDLEGSAQADNVFEQYLVETFGNDTMTEQFSNMVLIDSRLKNKGE